MSESADAVGDPIERRYRRLIRAYPAGWRAANGDVLLSVLLDSAEARGLTHPTARQSVDLVLHGLAERTREALPVSTRDLISGAALGTGLGFTLAYFVFYSWIRPDFYSGTVVAGPLWFFPAWLLLAVATRTGILALRMVAVALVLAVAVVVPITRIGPFPELPMFWPTSGAQPFKIVFGGVQTLPADAANVTFVALLALLTITGRSSHRPVLKSAAVALGVFGSAFGAAVFIARWPGVMRDGYIWSWLTLQVPSARFDGPFVGAPLLAAIAALAVTAVIARRRNPQASAILSVAAIALAASAVAMNLAPPVLIGL